MLQLLAAPMSIGSILGAIAGVFLAIRAPASFLKWILEAILAVSAIKLLYKTET